MAHLINYIWQSSFCLLFFFGIYWCFLKGEKVFGFTRIFLLVTPVLALLFPLIEIPVGFSKPTISLENTDFLQALTYMEDREDIVGTFGLPEVTVESTKLPVLLEWKDYLFLGYLVIALALTGRLLWQLLQMRLLREKGWYQTIFNLRHNYFLIPTFGLTPVFSFFDQLFWDDTQKLKPDEEAQIIRHELEHIRQGHSWDMIYYQILSILFWFNPGIHLMRAALIDVHEFSADANVVKTTASKESYTNLIVKIAFKGLDLPVGNYFIRSTTLKRIMMMKKTEKINWFKLLMVIPLTGMLLALVSMKSTNPSELLPGFAKTDLPTLKGQILAARDTLEVSTRVMKIPNPTHYEYVSSLQNGTVTAQLGGLQYVIGDISNDKEYKDVLQMINIFKQNTQFSKSYTLPDLHRSADVMPEPANGYDEWNAFLSKNLIFPTEARRLGATGEVYVEFIVNKEGKITEPSIVKSMGMGLDDEVLRILSLKDMPKWNPGKDDGNPVNTIMVLPVRFKLDGNTAQGESLFPTPAPTNPDVFDVVEQMPVPQGGMEGWTEYLSQNLKYPQEAKENGIHGTVYVSFIVSKTGEIQHAQILRGIGGGADEEALRVLQNAPDWIPGEQRGQKVNVKMRLPIKFAQADDAPEAKPIKKSNRLEEVVVVGYGAVGQADTPAVKIRSASTTTPLYVVNGKIYEKEDISDIKPEDIESINVLKGEKATEKYKEKGKEGVLEINLKEGINVPEKSGKGTSSSQGQIEENFSSIASLPESKQPIFLLNGSLISVKEVQQLEPKQIKSINVVKESAEMNIYGKKAENGVIEIFTK